MIAILGLVAKQQNEEYDNVIKLRNFENNTFNVGIFIFNIYCFSPTDNSKVDCQTTIYGNVFDSEIYNEHFGICIISDKFALNDVCR